MFCLNKAQFYIKNIALFDFIFIYQIAPLKTIFEITM